MNRRLRRWGTWVLGAVTVAAVGYFGAYLIDAVVHRDQVARNVRLDGQAIGGFGAADLNGALADLASSAATRPILLDGGDRSIETTLGEVGVNLDVESIRAETMAAGRDESFLADVASWWSSLFGESRDVGVGFTADPEFAEAALTARPDAYPYAPVEPAYTGVSGEFVVTPGSDGLRLHAADAAATILAASGTGYPPDRVDVHWDPVPPRIDEAALQASLDEADDLAIDLTVYVNGYVGTIGAGTVRRWIDSDLTDDGLEPHFDLARAEASVERLTAGFIDPGTPPVFTVVDGEVTAELGEEPMMCCGDGFGAELEESARNGNRTMVLLPATPVYEDAGLAAVEAMGIDQLVAEFTTNHKCCESRVDNIHRIADLVRGVVIEPGGRFSINEYIGERTRDKGFVAAGVIESGHFTDDVGGGISQFATTTFNAAFFAGLDFDDYQSHSIYISRYPYGREATLSFPEPDLVITNPTPYAVLIWTAYDDTSITVQMYSTPYFEVEETGQTVYRWGSSCRRVNTYRSRTTPDGQVTEDFVYATYRPGEGLDCNGNATPRPRG